MPGKPTYKIGFLINPIAGMGGAVALHSTDAENRLLALDRGAQPLAHVKAARALQGFRKSANNETSFRKIQFISVPGTMGGDLLTELGFEFTSVSTKTSVLTNAQDSIDLAKEFERKEVDLILFAGGDGTARDILSVVGTDTPIIGVPAGVKMRSAVFTRFPEEIAQVLQDIENVPKVELVYKEVLDAIWSNPSSENYSHSAYFGLAKTIKSRIAFSGSKARSSNDIDGGIQELADNLASEVRSHTGLVLIGSGTSTYSVKKALGAESTLQGVDAYSSGICIGQDLSELEILKLISKYETVKLIMGVIGGQGFLFGRGNQQISSAVINLITWSNLTVISAESKLLELFPVELYVDFEVVKEEQRIPTFIKVRTAPYKEMLVRLRSHERELFVPENNVSNGQQLVRSKQ